MKTFSLSIVALFFASTLVVNAQVGASNEPRAELSESGEMIILPSESRTAAPVAALEVKEKKAIIRNVSQKRDAKMGKMKNGYYHMASNQDWGTGARLNSFGYAPAAPAYSATELDQPIFPAGITEDQDEETTSTTSTTPQW